MFSPSATAVRRACRLLRFNGCRAHSRGASRKEPALGTILLWNDDWDLAGPARPLDVAGWELARDRRHAPLADAIVFHVPTLASSDLPEGRRPGQRWVAWSMESEVNYPQLADPAFVARFDLAMTYRRDADVWVPYLPRPEWLAAPVSPKTEPVPAVYFASSAIDRSGRHAYVAELMRHVAVDCYGACHRNRTLARDDGRTTKLATIARYRFTLAFENSIARDYVTEKFYDPLVAGSVPVVLGAPNVREFAPALRCYIDAADFEDPAALAAHLVATARDETAYARLVEWKRTGFSSTFASMLAAVDEEPWTRLARRLAGDGVGAPAALAGARPA
jgi:alpha-1,3-fucosyltransferase 10